MWHVATPEPSRVGRRVWSRGTRGDTRALLWDASVVPPDMWRRRSPPVPGGGVWCRGTCGDVGALLCQEAGSGAMGHVAMPEHSRAGRRGLVLWDLTYVFCVGVPGLQGTDSSLRAHLGRGSEPTGGANIFCHMQLLRYLYLSALMRWYGSTNGHVATVDWHGSTEVHDVDTVTSHLAFP
jgi:hypothetical protein